MWEGGSRVAAAVVGVCLVVPVLGVASALAQEAEHSGATIQQVELREELISDQELLLNTYRCLFGVDIELVPKGCVDGKPVGERKPLPVVVGELTEGDIALRDRLIEAQEALLNAYRCLFDVDLEVVRGGCPAPAAGVVANPVGQCLQQSQRVPLSFECSLDVASRLSPMIVRPADCPIPLGSPDWLPNASRRFYREGVHQGVDFACISRSVRAALGGRVVVAVGDYITPSSQDLDAVLATTFEVGATPPYTLIMLYGNYVVIDHGIFDGVGHVVSIYAHLEALDSDIRIGQMVEAGQVLGVMGNSGTVQEAAGLYDQGHHLHWELHVNGQFLGAGLSTGQTQQVYAALFAGGNDYPR